ncbi:MAG: D-threonate/D-erythronate kinase [Clostridiales bacterium]|nr:D-threonate/D-erythronate kinase [Clostridiales bacterium]
MEWSIKMDKLIIIADDLSGACDTGAYLCKCTNDINVLINIDNLDNYPYRENNIQIYNLNSRAINAQQAYRKIYQFGLNIQSVHNKVILKKIDTAYRGNVGAELDGLMNALDIKLSFIINALPAMNRITVGGYQIIDGKLLEQTEYVYDPVSAINESFVPDIIQQYSKTKVGTISLHTVRKGEIAKCVKNEIHKGSRILVFDAVTESDIYHILNDIYDIYKYSTLWTGSLGLIKYISELFLKKHKTKEISYIQSGRSKNTIGFTASAHFATENQIQKAEQKGFIEVIEFDIYRILDSKDQYLELEAVMHNCNQIIKNKSIIIRPKLKDKISYPNANQIILASLKILAEKICSEINIDKIILIGGDTSYSILNALGSNMLKLRNKIEDAIAYGIILDGKLAGKEIVIKGGSAGSEDAIIKMLQV